ncbi:hypothetical protein [Bradyrhizobium sp. DASA03120]
MDILKTSPKPQDVDEVERKYGNQKLTPSEPSTIASLRRTR